MAVIGLLSRGATHHIARGDLKPERVYSWDGWHPARAVPGVWEGTVYGNVPRLVPGIFLNRRAC